MNDYNYRQYEYDANERRKKVAQSKHATKSNNSYRNTKRNRKQS